MQPTRIACTLALLAGILPSGTGHAGTILGIVRAEGPAIENADTASSGYASRRYKFLERMDYASLTDFVVFIEGPEETAPSNDSRPVVRIAQRNGAFDPGLLVVSAGTVVEFPNEDEIFHNVFSMSDSTPFDLGLYKRGDTAKRIVFEMPGRVDVFCSIHTKMNCIVYVVPNRRFSQTDAKGRYAIRDVPPGTYRVRAWHDRLPARIETVIVPAQGDARMDFTLGLSQLPKS